MATALNIQPARKAIAHIGLVREIPEEKQPRRITISNGDAKVVEGTTKDEA